MNPRAWLTLFVAVPLFGAHLPPMDAVHLRRQIERTTPASGVTERIALPVSPFLTQYETNLCWVYSTLSALETNYRIAHPDSDLQLSRAQLQYRNWQDRYQREFALGDHYVRETGTGVDAVALIHRFGLVAKDDYVEPPVFYYDHPFAIASAANILETLDREIGKLPDTTHLAGESLSPSELAVEVLGDAEWEAYGLSDDNSESYRQHWDPDARRETQAYFVGLTKFQQVIHQSLKEGHALAISLCGHDIEMYGGEWDAQGVPLTYLVKDSVGDAAHAFYGIDPEKARNGRHLCGVTTIKLSPTRF